MLLNLTFLSFFFLLFHIRGLPVDPLMNMLKAIFMSPVFSANALIPPTFLRLAVSHGWKMERAIVPSSSQPDYLSNRMHICGAYIEQTPDHKMANQSVCIIHTCIVLVPWSSTNVKLQKTFSKSYLKMWNHTDNEDFQTWSEYGFCFAFWSLTVPAGTPPPICMCTQETMLVGGEKGPEGP